MFVWPPGFLEMQCLYYLYSNAKHESVRCATHQYLQQARGDYFEVYFKPAMMEANEHVHFPFTY
jgi:hypothetical protein